MNQPPVKQLDHVIARTPDAVSLHTFFSETLRLPVSWPLKSYAAFTSGGIALGNINLEILTVGPHGRSSEQADARFCAFAFECDSLEAAVKELGRRGLECSAVVPYIESPAEGLPKIHLWSNAFLDGLIGSDLWTRYIIFSTKMPGYMFWANLLRGSRIEQAGMSRLFDGALVFLVEYEYGNFANMPHWSEFKNHDEKRAADAESLRARGGGWLGVEALKEIVVGVEDYQRADENWKKLFAPVEPVAQGFWEIADGPGVRLVSSDKNGIQSLVLKVSDLARAETFLREKDMLGSITGDEIQIDPAKIYNLDIRLV